MVKFGKKSRHSPSKNKEKNKVQKGFLSGPLRKGIILSSVLLFAWASVSPCYEQIFIDRKKEVIERKEEKDLYISNVINNSSGVVMASEFKKADQKFEERIKGLSSLQGFTEKKPSSPVYYSDKTTNSEVVYLGDENVYLLSSEGAKRGPLIFLDIPDKRGNLLPEGEDVRTVIKNRSRREGLENGEVFTVNGKKYTFLGAYKKKGTIHYLVVKGEVDLEVMKKEEFLALKLAEAFDADPIKFANYLKGHFLDNDDPVIRIADTLFRTYNGKVALLSAFSPLGKSILEGAKMLGKGILEVGKRIGEEGAYALMGEPTTGRVPSGIRPPQPEIGRKKESKPITFWGAVKGTFSFLADAFLAVDSLRDIFGEGTGFVKEFLSSEKELNINTINLFNLATNQMKSAKFDAVFTYALWAVPVGGAAVKTAGKTVARFGGWISKKLFLWSMRRVGYRLSRALIAARAAIKEGKSIENALKDLEGIRKSLVMRLEKNMKVPDGAAEYYKKKINAVVEYYKKQINTAFDNLKGELRRISNLPKSKRVAEFDNFYASLMEQGGIIGTFINTIPFSSRFMNPIIQRTISKEIILLSDKVLKIASGEITEEALRIAARESFFGAVMGEDGVKAIAEKIFNELKKIPTSELNEETILNIVYSVLEDAIRNDEFLFSASEEILTRLSLGEKVSAKEAQEIIARHQEEQLLKEGTEAATEGAAREGAAEVTEEQAKGLLQRIKERLTPEWIQKTKDWFRVTKETHRNIIELSKSLVTPAGEVDLEVAKQLTELIGSSKIAKIAIGGGQLEKVAFLGNGLGGKIRYFLLKGSSRAAILAVDVSRLTFGVASIPLSATGMLLKAAWLTISFPINLGIEGGRAVYAAATTGGLKAALKSTGQGLYTVSKEVISLGGRGVAYVWKGYDRFSPFPTVVNASLLFAQPLTMVPRKISEEKGVKEKKKLFRNIKHQIREEVINALESAEETLFFNEVFINYLRGEEKDNSYLSRILNSIIDDAARTGSVKKGTKEAVKKVLSLARKFEKYHNEWAKYHETLSILQAWAEDPFSINPDSEICRAIYIGGNNLGMWLKKNEGQKQAIVKAVLNALSSGRYSITFKVNGKQIEYPISTGKPKRDFLLKNNKGLGLPPKNEIDYAVFRYLLDNKQILVKDKNLKKLRTTFSSYSVKSTIGKGKRRVIKEIATETRKTQVPKEIAKKQAEATKEALVNQYTNSLLRSFEKNKNAINLLNAKIEGTETTLAEYLAEKMVLEGLKLNRAISFVNDISNMFKNVPEGSEISKESVDSLLKKYISK